VDAGRRVVWIDPDGTIRRCIWHPESGCEWVVVKPADPLPEPTPSPDPVPVPDPSAPHDRLGPYGSQFQCTFDCLLRRTVDPHIALEVIAELGLHLGEGFGGKIAKVCCMLNPISRVWLAKNVIQAACDCSNDCEDRYIDEPPHSISVAY
jgi:hypothetical protein